MEASHRSLSRTLVFVAKVLLAVGILAFLIYKAQSQDLFSELLHQRKNWLSLIIGFVCAFLSVALSFVRWQQLVVGQRIKFSTADAFRLGSLGYALNFVSPGNLGGDFIKAVLLARGQPGRRTEAIATVLLDRLMGLAAMLLLASGGILLSGLLHSESAPLRSLCWAILGAALSGFVIAVLLVFVPRVTGDAAVSTAESLPLVGPTVAKLLRAVSVYRVQKPLLARAAALSIVVDLLYVVSFYLVAKGLPFATPSLEQHLVIVPVAALAGAIPATPGGLGSLEAATEALYRSMPGVDNVGAIVTLAHRLTTVVVASIGLVYYILYRAEVRELIAAEGSTSGE